MININREMAQYHQGKIDAYEAAVAMMKNGNFSDEFVVERLDWLRSHNVAKLLERQDAIIAEANDSVPG